MSSNSNIKTSKAMNEQELEKVYATIDYLTKANIPVPEELIQRAGLMENNYIAEQVIPAVKQAVEETISPLLSAFSIEVCYRPESGVHCALTLCNTHGLTTNSLSLVKELLEFTAK